MQTEDKAKMVGAIVVMTLIGIAVINIALNSYKPEDLSNSTPIRSFVFNQCEKYPSQDSFFRGNPTIIYTNPQETGQTGRLESCLGWTVDVYREEDYEGDKWILFKAGDIQGWQKSEVME